MSQETGRLAVSRAKITPPRLCTGFVSRRRLLDALHVEDPADRAVILVSAPAGYGKSMILADWVGRGPGPPAWVNLSPDDQDDRRFWSAILAALSSCPAVPDDSALHTLRLPETPSRDPSFMAAVVNTMDALAVPLTLVLDDVHEVTGDSLHGLTVLVRDRPAGLRLVLSSRFDPPLRLDRLRLDGWLVEVRAPQLALTLPETQSLLTGISVTLRAEQLRLLHEETGGWAAGLRLLAVALREAGDADLVLRDLIDNERAVADYLVGEILSALSVDQLEVLTAVSLCDEVNVELAAVVSRREDAGDVLADVERETSLVTSYGTGRTWFRIHPLLRAHLRVGLQRRRPDLVSARHGSASRWHIATGELAAALDHARQAADPELLGELLRDHGVQLAVSGHHDAVCQALEVLPRRWPQSDPGLAVVAALAHLETGQVAAADRFLDDADAAWPAAPAPALSEARNLVTARRAWFVPVRDVDGVGRARVELVRERGGPEPHDDVDRAAALLQVSEAMEAGAHRRAATIARTALGRAENEPDPYLAARAVTLVAAQYGLLGEVREMIALATRTDEIAPAQGWRGTVLHAHAQGMIAYGALLRSGPAHAIEVLDRLDEVLGDRGNQAEVRESFPLLDIVRHAACFDLGHQRSALYALQAARTGSTAGWVLDRPTDALKALLEHGAAMRMGWRDHARSLVQWAEAHLGSTGDVQLMRARGLAAISRFDVARERLRPLLELTEAPVVPWALAAGWTLESVVLVRTGRRRLARTALAEALTLAETTGVLRPLVLAGNDLSELLAEHRGAGEQVAREVLALRREVRSAESVAALTEREREVLDMLPTVMSLEEIADALAVSVNTVKTHVRAIYAKLGVSNRREALLAARRDGLLALGHTVAAMELA